jgi:hypothetical protein
MSGMLGLLHHGDRDGFSVPRSGIESWGPFRLPRPRCDRATHPAFTSPFETTRGDDRRKQGDRRSAGGSKRDSHVVTRPRHIIANFCSRRIGNFRNFRRC